MTAAVLSIGAMVTPTPSESAPCSCWDRGEIGCHNLNNATCSRCWAAWDTGVFSPSFDLAKETAAVKAEVDKVYNGVTSKENVDKAVNAVMGAAGVPFADKIWEAIQHGSAFIGAGIDAMELCKKACHSAKAKYNLTAPYSSNPDGVWWYADETALNSCKNYQNWYNASGTATPKTIDIINKFQYDLK